MFKKWHISFCSMNQFNCNDEHTFFHTCRKPQSSLGDPHQSRVTHGSVPDIGFWLRRSLHVCDSPAAWSSSTRPPGRGTCEAAVGEFSLPGHSRQPLLGDFPHPLGAPRGDQGSSGCPPHPLIHQLQELLLVWRKFFSGFISSQPLCCFLEGIPSPLYFGSWTQRKQEVLQTPAFHPATEFPWGKKHKGRQTLC